VIEEFWAVEMKACKKEKKNNECLDLVAAGYRAGGLVVG
jgi:hypothetical protein